MFSNSNQLRKCVPMCLTVLAIGLIKGSLEDDRHESGDYFLRRTLLFHSLTSTVTFSTRTDISQEHCLTR